MNEVTEMESGSVIVDIFQNTDLLVTCHPEKPLT